jgi:GT2 family glycosyltransferase/cephalosporin hydroxylase
VGVPNHVRAWKTSLYNKIGKHNSTLPVSDDYELLLRSFLHGKWLHIPVCAYFQYRNAHGNNFTFLRNELIQHSAAWIWNKYEASVQLKFQELGVKLLSDHPYVPVWKLETEVFPTLETTWLPAPFNVSTTISIVIPTFNRAELLVRAIRSVCAQTDGDWMMFVVGDKCPTLEVTMNALEKDSVIRPFLHRIQWWNLLEHSGKWGAVSRNFGLRMLSKTEWVTYLDDDNEWAPSHLSSLRDTASKNPSAQAVFSSMMVEDKPIVCKRAAFGRVDASGFLHKRSLASKFGFWPMEHATYANDWKFVERWVKAGVKFAFTHQPTLLYNTSTNAQSFDSISALCNDDEEESSVGLPLATVPTSIQLEWNESRAMLPTTQESDDKPLDIALSFNDRYVGFFEPFGHDMDAVLVDNCVFNTDKINSVTCFMTLRSLSPSSPVTNVILYQTEQLSREMELARVTHELLDAKARGVHVKVLQYSRFNMRALEDRMGSNAPVDHVFKPLVTPPAEIAKLKKLLRVLHKTDDLAFSNGPSERRSHVVKRLRDLGFKVRFIENSFGQERDVGVASCKVLMNIHAAEDFRVFETSRCLRWLDAGHTVVTEESEDLQEYLDKYPNLILVPFASIMEGHIPHVKPVLHNWIEDISSAWKGHRRFAEWLVNTMKPKTIVDLGVDFGYSTFVWATAGANHGTEVFGIDMFEGDPQTGLRNTFDSVKKRAADHKLTNLNILRADFASVAQLWCRLVDILHIDGYHTMEAVSADFANWSPHVSQMGVILFHDTAVQQFGIKDFFATLPKEDCFEFFHSCGLGVYTKNKELLQKIRAFQ